MGKKGYYDEKTGIYVPSDSEMGITDSDYYGNNPITYEIRQRMITQWQQKNEQNQQRKLMAKIKREEEWAKRHWYNRLDYHHKKKLIDDSRSNMDWVFDRLDYGQKPPKILESFRKLKIKVSGHNFIMDPVDVFKLKQFPKYDSANDELVGTRTSFLRLWTFVFSSRRVSK